MPDRNWAILHYFAIFVSCISHVLLLYIFTVSANSSVHHSCVCWFQNSGISFVVSMFPSRLLGSTSLMMMQAGGAKTGRDPRHPRHIDTYLRGASTQFNSKVQISIELNKCLLAYTQLQLIFSLKLSWRDIFF